MAEHKATITWERNGQSFTDRRYSRGHVWQFDEGVKVAASSSPHNVPLPWSVAAAVDPEEALVAAVSSCHMLWFLSIAAGRGFTVESYRDEASGVMGKNSRNQQAMTRIMLRPHVRFSGERSVSRDELHSMHHESHEQCFVAHSVIADIECEPVFHE
jgi:organic hydroperoxide reductase OsmC/OhrA